MRKLNLVTASILLISAVSANAAYVVKVALDKNSIDFKQAHDNLGLDPNADNTSTDEPSCLIKTEDFSAFGGYLIQVKKEKNFKCVVSYSVPKQVFDGECNPNSYPETVKLWDMMRSKGVDGVSSWYLSGECV